MGRATPRIGRVLLLRHPEACRGFFTDGCDNPLLHTREPHRANDFRGCANDFTKYQNMSQRICQDCQTRGQIILLCYFGELITFFYQLPMSFINDKSEQTHWGITKTTLGFSFVSTKNEWSLFLFGPIKLVSSWHRWGCLIMTKSFFCRWIQKS